MPKTCTKCQKNLPTTQFYRRSRSTNTLMAECKTCRTDYHRKKREANLRRTHVEIPPTKHCPRCRESKPAANFVHNRGKHDGLDSHCRPCRAAYERLRRYGLSKSDLTKLEEAHAGRCAVCQKNSPLHIDHCHDTARVRGLLCQCCNMGLGLFRDNPAYLRRAADYLAQTKGAGAAQPPPPARAHASPPPS
jgi:hypothetical protein